MSDGLTCRRCRRVVPLPTRAQRVEGRGLTCPHDGTVLLPQPVVIDPNLPRVLRRPMAAPR